MSRLTDERIDEILRPKDIIGQTELESLASEVRELREQLAAVESCRDKYGERERKAVSTMFDERKSMLETIRRLTNEIADDRDLLRRFRACVDIHEDLDGIRSLDGKGLRKVCRDYDTRFGQQPEQHVQERCPECNGRGYVAVPENDSEDHGRITGWKTEECDYCQAEPQQAEPQQPEPAGELVPWDAETRPRGTIWTRFSPDHDEQYMIVGWDSQGAFDRDEHIDWETLFECRQWSRDGITWQRCGVVR